MRFTSRSCVASARPIHRHFAVAQDDGTIGAFADFTETVGNVDGADALLTQFADEFEQAFGLGQRQAGVGSSMMTSRALSESALAISTSAGARGKVYPAACGWKSAIPAASGVVPCRDGFYFGQSAAIR